MSQDENQYKLILDNLSDGVIISNIRNDSIGWGNHQRPYPIRDIETFVHLG